MPRAMPKAANAATEVPMSMHRAPFCAPKSTPLASDSGCVGNIGMHSHTATASAKAAGPKGPSPSTIRCRGVREKRGPYQKLH
jgi:hypothetical protein